MLRDIIPANWRKPIYAIYSVIGVVLGAIQIAIDPDPAWLTTSMTVYLFLGGAIGAVASGNTPPVQPNEAEVAAFVEDNPEVVAEDLADEGE